MECSHSGTAWERRVGAFLYGVEIHADDRSDDILGSISSSRITSRRCGPKRKLARCPNLRKSKRRSLERSQEALLGITKL